MNNQNPLNIEEEVEFMNDFNSKYSIGDKVKFTFPTHSEILTVKCNAFMHHGEAVVYFEECHHLHSVDTTLFDIKPIENK